MPPKKCLLLSLPSGAFVPINKLLQLGRAEEWECFAKSVSRQQAELSPSSNKDKVTFRVVGRNPCIVTQVASDTITVLKQNESLDLVSGDQFSFPNLREKYTIVEPNGSPKRPREEVLGETPAGQNKTFKAENFSEQDGPNADLALDLHKTFPPEANQPTLSVSSAVASVKDIMGDNFTDQDIEDALNQSGQDINKAIDFLLSLQEIKKTEKLDQTPSLSPGKPDRATKTTEPEEPMTLSPKPKLRRTTSELERKIQKYDSFACSGATPVRKKEKEKAQKEIIKLLVSDRAALEQEINEKKSATVQLAAEEAERLCEKEALAGDKLKIFTILPERSFTNDAASNHFRTAESQFHRFLVEYGGGGHQIEKVEYIVNPVLVRKFETKRLELAREIDWEDTKPILCFHGTQEQNISSIIKENFLLSRVGSSTDAGWYGAGVYFSPNPSLSMGYARNCSQFLLCQVILGRTYKCPKVIGGVPCMAGYHSHCSPCGQELVIFDSDQILPYYIVHYGKKTAPAPIFGGFGFGLPPPGLTLTKAAAPLPAPKVKECLSWKETGWCEFGDECYYVESHKKG